MPGRRGRDRRISICRQRLGHARDQRRIDERLIALNVDDDAIIGPAASRSDLRDPVRAARMANIREYRFEPMPLRAPFNLRMIGGDQDLGGAGRKRAA